MKKNIVLSLAFALCVPVGALVAAESDYYGQTFYTVRPQFQSPMPEKSTLFRHQAKMRDCGWNGALQIVPFGGQSTNAKNMGKFFGPSPKTSWKVISTENALTIADPADALDDDKFARADGRDINPVYFNIDYQNEPTTQSSTYSSEISFRPKQTVWGIGFEWRQYLGWWNDCCDPKWWFAINGPVEQVENNMTLSETTPIITGTIQAGGAKNMIQAFTGDQPYTYFGSGVTTTMNYGLIDGKRKKTGFADLEVKIGYDYISEDYAYLSGYIGFVAPTGNTPKGVYVFEPIVGNNHHWGIITGGYAGFELWGCDDRGLFFEVETNSRYLFKNVQTRSFDLANRPWSRYMFILPNATATLVDYLPGINVLTQKMNIHPHFQHSVNMGLVYNHCRFQGEIGYNFWMRQCESVSLKTPWVNGPAIAGLSFAAAATNLLSNIAIDNAASDQSYSAADNLLILASDLNLQSAAHPAALSHTVYGSLGYSFDCCWPIFVGLGGSYEFSTNNAALDRWLVWGKLGVSI